MPRVQNIMLIVVIMTILIAAMVLLSTSGAAVPARTPAAKGLPVISIPAAPAASAAVVAQSNTSANVWPALGPGYVSEETLWEEFNHAADRHSAAEARGLLRILNMRHEHRCCGLPR